MTSGRIAQADVDEVKARTDLGILIGERVALRPAGVGSLKGLCPFHDERTPSFHVRPQSGFYHCFGCGESGDAYTFVQKMDQLSFSEAVERLAARVGYPLHTVDGDQRERSGRVRLYQANAAAAEFFRAQLAEPDAEPARRFLGERGFDAGAAAHFGVGFAPRGWSGLTESLRTRGFTTAELQSSGLVAEGRRGVYDRFRGRVVWPIRDVTGQTVGFGARRLFDDDQGPKYLNTPETAIYRKSQVLYGLDLAKKDIARQRTVVIVEGYTDVMACHLAGVSTAVATCGTAFGPEHIAAIRRVMGDDTAAGQVIFTFDPDAAGQQAALRAFGDEKRFAAQTYVAVPPAGLDPCDLRIQRGDAAVRMAIEARTPMFEFVIDRRLSDFDLSTVEGRAGALRAAAPVVAGIRDPTIRPGYIRVLARRLGADLEEVAAAVTAVAAQAPPVPTRPPSAADPVSPRPLRLADLSRAAVPDTALERDALMGLLQYADGVPTDALRAALGLRLHHPALDAIRAAIAAAPDVHRPGWAADAVATVPEQYRALAADLLAADFPARDEDAARASTADLVRRLRIRDLDGVKAALLGEIQRVPPDSEEGRAVRIRLREVDGARQALTADR